MSPSEAADIAELNQLAFRYAAAVDACDPDRFRSVFWPDARLSVFAPGAENPASVAQGHDQLAAIPVMMRELYDRTAHLMTNHLVELDGERASGNLLCTARHLVGGEDRMVVIRYMDRYERRDGRWLILDREIRFQWSEVHPAVAGEAALALIAGERTRSPEPC